MRVLIGLILSTLLVTAVGTSQAQAPSSAPMIQIKDAGMHIGERVTIEGLAGQQLPQPSPTTYAFNLVGDDNTPIKVRTSMGYPKHGATYQIVGRVYADPPDASGNTYAELIEEPGGHILSPGFADPDRPYVGADKPYVGGNGGGLPPTFLGIIVAICVLLIILIVVLIVTLRGDSGKVNETVSTEGSTIKLQVGTAAAIKRGTVKVLPGRFEITDGDTSMREMRLFATEDNPGREFLLKRVDSGAAVPSNVIGFKSPTISSNQGKLICSGSGAYTIINYADPIQKNPIVINGQPLGENGSSLLSDGDLLQIGEVKLKYHANA